MLRCSPPTFSVLATTLIACAGLLLAAQTSAPGDAGSVLALAAGGSLVRWGLVAGGLAMLGGVGLSYLSQRNRRSEKRSEGVSNAEAAGTPWEGRRAWRTPVMKHEGTSGPWVPAIGFTVGGGLLAGAFIWNAIIRAANPDWAALLTLLFPLVGSFLLYRCLKARKRRKRFGVSELEMETMPGRLGRRLVAEVRARLPRDTFPEHGVQVQLSCYRRTVRQKRTTDSDGDSSTKLVTKNDLMWRGEKQMKARTYRDGHAHIPVSFSVPADLPPSTTHKRSKTQLARTGEADFIWKVAVRADVPGVDYEARFEVPVYPPDEAEAPASPRSEDPNQDEAPAEAVLWNLERDEEALQVGRGEADATSDDPYAEYEIVPELTEPISRHISLERLSGRGVTLHVAPDRSLKAVALMTGLGLLGALLTTGAVLAIGEGALLMSLLLGLFGIALLFATWSLAMSETTITVSDGAVVVKQGTLRKKKTQFPATEVDAVRVLLDGSDTSTDYEIVVERTSTATAAGNAAGVAQTMGQVFGGEAEAMIKDEMAKVQNRAAHLRGLHNKHEADWLAEQLRAAITAEQRYA